MRAGIRFRAAWVAATLLAAVLAGWAAARISGERALDALQLRTGTDATLRAALLDSEIARYRLLPLALADDRDIVEAVAAPGVDHTALDRRLELLARATGAPVIYVVGRSGRAIASSNHAEADSFVGRDYAFRSYYTDALAGGQAHQFALGTSSKQPGLYLAHRTPGDGVVVIKLEFNRIEAEWRAAGGITLIRGPEGVVLVTSRPDWRYGATEPLEAARARRFIEGASLPGDALHPLDPARAGAFVQASVATAQPGWRLTELAETAPVLRAARRGSATAAALAVIAASSLLWMWRGRRVRQRRDRAALERAVAARTVELRHEMAERVASETRAAELRERLRQANRLAALGQITAALAHETAQPVGAIRSYCRSGELLLDRGDTQAARGNFSAIGGLAERIGTITAELRGFARRGPDPLRAVRVADFIGGARLILRERLGGIALSVPDPLPELLVHGSVVRFEQVLVNLLGNAIEALEGAGRIEIEIAADASAVRLSVSDDGPGIAPELAAQLFLPFATSRPSGLGLGLVIAHDIMAECGGTLRQLDRARGACFEMTMRRVAA